MTLSMSASKRVTSNNNPFLFDPIVSGIPIILNYPTVGLALSPKRKLISLTTLTLGM